MFNFAIGITLSRILLTPVVIVLLVGQHWLLATLIFAIAAATDLLDGFVARRFNQQTRLGQLLDPIADKCLLMGAMYCLLMMIQLDLIKLNQLSVWHIVAVYFLLAKEIIFLGVGGWLMYRYRFFIQPSRLSRATSVAEIILVLSILLALINFGYVPSLGLSVLLAGNITLSVWLLVRYAAIIYNYLRNEKK